MTKLREQDILYSKQIWIRGIQVTLEATETEMTIRVGSILLEQFPVENLSEMAFDQMVMEYKRGMRRGTSALSIPKARTNTTDEFVYQNEAGEWSVLSGYANFEWEETDLSQEERDSGYFFLTQTNETLGSLIHGHTYTTITFTESNYPTVERHLSLTDLVERSQDLEWMTHYLSYELLIFDDAKAVTLDPTQWNVLWVGALNENSRFKRLESPLTPEDKQFYFSRQELKKCFGYDVYIANVNPSGYTLKQSKKGNVTTTYYYHSDLIPQSFLCKCGKNTNQTGHLSERICWDCLDRYQESCVQRSIEHFKMRYEERLQGQELEPAFIVLHSNQGVTEPIREMINICITNQDQEILFQTEIKPTGELSKNNRNRGYEATRLATAPTLKDVHEQIKQVTEGKLVVWFNEKDRMELYRANCDQAGISPMEFPHHFCLKEVLNAISYGAKRKYKLCLKHGEALPEPPHGLEMECAALNIDIPEGTSIQKDSMIMGRIFQVLKQQALSC